MPRRAWHTIDNLVSVTRSSTVANLVDTEPRQPDHGQPGVAQRLEMLHQSRRLEYLHVWAAVYRTPRLDDDHSRVVLYLHVYHDYLPLWQVDHGIPRLEHGMRL